MPAAYLTFSGRYAHKPDYLVDFMDDSRPYYTNRRRLSQYLKQYESHKWQNVTGTDYPALLLIADSSDLERRLQKSMAFNLSSRNLFNLQVYTATLKTLQNSERVIVTSVTDPKNTLQL